MVRDMDHLVALRGSLRKAKRKGIVVRRTHPCTFAVGCFAKLRFVNSSALNLQPPRGLGSNGGRSGGCFGNSPGRGGRGPKKGIGNPILQNKHILNFHRGPIVALTLSYA
jgi:hypothetical protein